MQWRRRHCCTHAAKFLVLLLVTVLMVFLVDQVWLPMETSRPWWRGHPVAKGNISALQTTLRSDTGPQPTFKADANISTPEKEAVSSPQGDPSPPVNILATNTTQKPFTYIINEPDKCPDSKPAPFLVLLIATEARQVEARNAIRQTWGNENVAPALGFIRLFLLGKKEGEMEEERQRMLEEESRKYHDIIQRDFLDTYNNLAKKTLMGMNWVAVHCPQAGYVMKTDSDMFVNTEYLIYKLLKPELKPKEDFFTGFEMRFLRNRNKNSKWYMPPELYPGEKYPAFCSGTGYVFSGDLARKIYDVSLTIPHHHLEDVYVGICLAKLQIKSTPPPSELLFNQWRVPYSSCRYSQLITSHGIRPNEILEYWHHLKSNPCIESRQDTVKQKEQRETSST